jgi:hypothetical protein
MAKSVGKRKLVELSGYHHSKLSTIISECRRIKKKPPTLAALVSRALDLSMETLATEHLTK